jgi:hypothetical protein
VGRIGRQICPSGIGIVVCLCLLGIGRQICPIGIVVFVFLCLQLELEEKFVQLELLVV